ncbi:MAG: hypothetical protein Q8P75_02505 [bacterium]|nr:hypothetical protein [bacterium]
MARRAKRSRSKKPTVWQALNDPVVETPEEFAKLILLVSFVIIAMAWLSPYFGNPSDGIGRLAGSAPRPVVHSAVAGAFTENNALFGEEQAPEWYLTIDGMGSAIQSSFAFAANEVLDISEPVSGTVEFYAPGVTAVWDAWLELMADPY